VGAVKNADIFFCQAIIPTAKSFENNLELTEAVMHFASYFNEKGSRALM
jgi:hypothetical protein